MHLFAAGVMVPQAIVAAQRLASTARSPSVFVVTSPDRLYRGLREPRPYLETLVGADEEDVPVVSVLDGHSHALAFLGRRARRAAARARRGRASASRARGSDLYRHYGIDARRDRRRGPVAAGRLSRTGYTSSIPMATLAADRKSASAGSSRALVGPGGVLSEPDELLVYESDGLTLLPRARGLRRVPDHPPSTWRPIVRLANRERPAVRGARRRHRAVRAAACRPRAASCCR